MRRAGWLRWVKVDKLRVVGADRVVRPLTSFQQLQILSFQLAKPYDKGYLLQPSSRSPYFKNHGVVFVLRF